MSSASVQSAAILDLAPPRAGSARRGDTAGETGFGNLLRESGRGIGLRDGPSAADPSTDDADSVDLSGSLSAGEAAAGEAPVSAYSRDGRLAAILAGARTGAPHAKGEIEKAAGQQSPTPDVAEDAAGTGEADPQASDRADPTPADATALATAALAQPVVPIVNADAASPRIVASQASGDTEAASSDPARRDLKTVAADETSAHRTVAAAERGAAAPVLQAAAAAASTEPQAQDVRRASRADPRRGDPAGQSAPTVPGSKSEPAVPQVERSRADAAVADPARHAGNEEADADDSSSRQDSPADRPARSTAGSATVIERPMAGLAPAPQMSSTAVSLVSDLAPRLEATTATAMPATQDNAARPLDTLRIQLKPVHLGTVTASLRIEDGQLSVEIAVETDDARQQLAGDRDTIERALRSLGLDVGEVRVVHTQTTQATQSQQSASARPDGQPQNQFSQHDGASGSTGGERGQEDGNEFGRSSGEAAASSGQAADGGRGVRGGDVFI